MLDGLRVLSVRDFRRCPGALADPQAQDARPLAQHALWRDPVCSSASLVGEERGIGSGEGKPERGSGEERTEDEEDNRREINMTCGPILSVRVAGEPSWDHLLSRCAKHVQG